jgi:hypothetical protein
MPDPLATAAKCGPYFASLSRMRYAGAAPKGVASRSCWATQASVGERVTPTCTMRREPSSVRTKANNGRKNRSWTCRKSPAQMSVAWLRTNVVQVWPRGRGGRACSMYRWIVRLATLMSSFSNSPRMRSAPQSRLSTAIALIRAMVSAGSLGSCAVVRDFRFQNSWNPWRCQRSTVSGLTMSSASFHHCNRLASRTTRTRSERVKRGRLTERLRTRSCWRSRAFSMTSWGLLRARSRRLPRVSEALGGSVQDRRRSWSACTPAATISRARFNSFTNMAYSSLRTSLVAAVTATSSHLARIVLATLALAAKHMLV